MRYPNSFQIRMQELMVFLYAFIIKPIKSFFGDLKYLFSDCLLNTMIYCIKNHRLYIALGAPHGFLKYEVMQYESMYYVCRLGWLPLEFHINGDFVAGHHLSRQLIVSGSTWVPAGNITVQISNIVFTPESEDQVTLARFLSSKINAAAEGVCETHGWNGLDNTSSFSAAELQEHLLQLNDLPTPEPEMEVTVKA
jgi:hypothetical protein